MADKRTLAPGIYALLDDGLLGAEVVPEVAQAVVAGGVRVLQLRLERSNDRVALEVVRAVVAAVGARAQVIVNDRADLALLGGAAGVHLGDDDLPVPEARRLLGPGALIGATCRDAQAVARAKAQGADHAGVGPVLATSTKAVAAPTLGVAGLARVVREAALPVVAIAGLGLESVGAVAKAGAHGAAVASGLSGPEGFEARARALCEAWARK